MKKPAYAHLAALAERYLDFSVRLASPALGYRAQQRGEDGRPAGAVLEALTLDGLAGEMDDVRAGITRPPLTGPDRTSC